MNFRDTFENDPLLEAQAVALPLVTMVHLLKDLLLLPNDLLLLAHDIPWFIQVSCLALFFDASDPNMIYYVPN